MNSSGICIGGIIFEMTFKGFDGVIVDRIEIWKEKWVISGGTVYFLSRLNERSCDKLLFVGGWDVWLILFSFYT